MTHRVAVLDKELCQPKKCGLECIKYCPVNKSGADCIILNEETKKAQIDEDVCNGCGICVKVCPFDAITIVNLASELSTDKIHQYGINSFRLYKLPTPKKGEVVGLLGRNGMGKSTVVNILSGNLKPNLGNYSETTEWDDILKFYKGTELKSHFEEIKNGNIRASIKPQQVHNVVNAFNGTGKELLEKYDERGVSQELIKKLGLMNSVERNLSELSGGELQRLAVAVSASIEADFYFFDEPSSYLDIHERMRIVRIIQELAETARVIVIEHDLAVLDVLADLIHIVYGMKGAFGIFTPARSTRQAINSYLDGFLVEQNVRIRDKPIRFLTHTDRSGNPVVEWGDLEKKLGDFQLKTGTGKVHQAEVVGVVGPNGTGKTTMVKILAGEHEYDAGWVTADARISYKPQHIDVDMDCTVQTWIDSEIGLDWRSGEFNVNVIRALDVDQLLAKRVNTLSGGELQAVAIAICLGRDADLYLLDEPSAHLDANARMEAAKAIRRTMESNEKAAFVIDHDVYFIDIVSDSLLVFEGKGGIHGSAEGPFPLRTGMNRFLKGVDITFRRDHDSKRPRINKGKSRKDREQRTQGDYYSFES